MVEIKKRAISPEQKALRCRKILETAGEMFLERSYEAVNLSDIAAVVGITKPALYRYFRGKEPLFLALFTAELEALRLDFEATSPPEHLGAAVARLFASRPLYCQLSAILHTVLEKDLTYAEALAFKLNMKSTVEAIGQHVQNWFGDDLATEQVGPLLMQAQQALIGVWHMTHPVGAMKEVLDREPQLAGMCQDFEETLAAHLTTLFRR